MLYPIELRALLAISNTSKETLSRTGRRYRLILM
jgi:hypothetical protein